MEHFKPHKGSKFEGYYSKFRLPSGASLALIICTVPEAEQRPNMLSFTYVPHDASKIFQKEVWADRLEMVTISTDNAFELRLPGIGYMKCHADSTTEYSLAHADFTFHAKTTTRTPWSQATETPEGLLVNLPLPLHWHVQSFASECTFDLAIPSHHALLQEDKQGLATVHEEKNWASSFPSAHIWVQARDADRGICIAGGQILGLEAYLLGYRSSRPDLSMDFRPPLAVKIAGLSPTMSVRPSWTDKSFEMSVQSWRRKIVVRASAPEGTFFSLSSPFPEGHRENFLGQSFRSTITVRIYEAGWVSGWTLVHEEVFEGGSLEFGGGYYPPAGSASRFH